MDIEEFDAFDIGQHYLKLQGVGMEDKDIGKALRRFVQEHAPTVADEKGMVYGVECERVEKDS